MLRWFLDGTLLAQLACDHRIGRSTAYRYPHGGIDALAVQAPGLRGAMLAARATGHTHMHVDGTLIRTDHCHDGPPATRWPALATTPHGPQLMASRACAPGHSRPSGWIFSNTLHKSC